MELTKNLPIQIKGLTKTGIETLSNTIIETVEKGDENAGNLYLKLDFLKKSIDKAMKDIKEDATEELNKYDKGQTLLGVEIQIVTKPRYDYKHNSLWVEKKEELKAIEQSMLLVFKSGNKMYDEEGTEISAAKSTYLESITPKYPK